MCNTLQSPEIVISELMKNSSNNEFKFKRLYRILYNPEMYKMAYSEMSSKEGNMTPGIDGKTIDGMSLERIESLINKLRDYSYTPNPAKRVYIEKKSSNKKRPLGIPTIDDKMVQYVVKYILEAIYENTFSNHSHGFRPLRSCHTALQEIEQNFRGVKWFIEGDIEGFFDNIDHHVLINIIRRRIQDEHFIGLLWKFLKAGYLEEWIFHKTYSGTPQGGIISPILANIYLNELDKYLDEYTIKFNKGNPKDRKRNNEARAIESRMTRLNKKMKANWDKWNEEDKKNHLKILKEYKRKKVNLPYYESQDDNYKKMYYVRYADDFLIGIVGSKEDAKKIKSDIGEYLKVNLKLNLSQEKTLVTHSNDRAKFLGYDIFISRDTSLLKDKNGVTKRGYNYNVILEVPKQAWMSKLLNFNVLKIIKDEKGKEKWMPMHRPEIAHLDDLEILTRYNQEIRGLRNYYQFANNATVLQKYSYIMEYSMYKTFANKYKTSIGGVKKKFNINGKFGIKYKTRTGENISYFYKDGFKKTNLLKHKFKKDMGYDVIPETAYLYAKTSLMKRFEANICEVCGEENIPLEMHHVRKLKDLKGKTEWEKLMISKKRKTLATCKSCHARITTQQKQDVMKNNNKLKV